MGAGDEGRGGGETRGAGRRTHTSIWHIRFYSHTRVTYEYTHMHKWYVYIYLHTHPAGVLTYTNIHIRHAVIYANDDHLIAGRCVRAFVCVCAHMRERDRKTDRQIDR